MDKASQGWLDFRPLVCDKLHGWLHGRATYAWFNVLLLFRNLKIICNKGWHIFIRPHKLRSGSWPCTQCWLDDSSPHSTEGKPRPWKGELSVSAAGGGLVIFSYGAVGPGPPRDAQEQEGESWEAHVEGGVCRARGSAVGLLEVPDRSRGC